jgi:hypothetical protein
MVEGGHLGEEMRGSFSFLLFTSLQLYLISCMVSVCTLLDNTYFLSSHHATHVLSL